jgi:hypothetical protein
LAADKLRLGVDLVADWVNTFAVTRDSWRRAALDTTAHVLEVEVVCSDLGEHRRRAEQRTVDVPSLETPTWQAITEREYAPWEGEPLVVDTAVVDVSQGVNLILETIAADTRHDQ